MSKLITYFLQTAHRAQMVFLLGFLLISTGILLSSPAKASPNSDIQQKITVTGIAKNGKAGAIILTNEDRIYYIDGQEAWEEELLDKEMEVTGFLKVEISPAEDLLNENGEWIQGMEGEKYTLLEASWKQPN